MRLSFRGFSLPKTLTVCVTAALFVTAGTVTVFTARSYALDLPTWDDVQAAKRDEAAASAKITEIQNLIERTRQDVSEKQSASEAASAGATAAEERFEAADSKASRLDEQVEEGRKEAEKIAERAASLVAQLYRSGGVDRNLQLFLDADEHNADTLLDKMAMISKSTERNTELSYAAAQSLNTLRSLSEQAAEAKKERESLYAQAREAAAEAAARVEVARQQQLEAEENERVLQAQLAALQDKTSSTVEGYQERLRIEEEQRRAEEESRRRAAEASRESASSGGGGSAYVPPEAASSGWGMPVSRSSYSVTCRWGCYSGHRGIDLGARTGTPIYAASAGRVVYSGWWGGYGNMVAIDHQNGVETRYAHMVSAPVVANGQWVGQGEIIGYVGSTGNSTGPHLHFETLISGTKTNPEIVMARFGIYF